MVNLSLSLLAIAAAWTVRGGLCSPTRGDSAGTDSLSKRTARCVSLSKNPSRIHQELRNLAVLPTGQETSWQGLLPTIGNFPEPTERE